MVPAPGGDFAGAGERGGVTAVEGKRRPPDSNRHDRFGTLGGNRPVAAAELLRPSHLRLAYEDLAYRAAEIERLGISLLVEEVRPVLAGGEVAEAAVRVADAKAVRVGHRFVAVRAEEVALY